MEKEGIEFLDYKEIEITYKDIRAGLIQLLFSHYAITEILFESIDNKLVEDLINKIRQHLSFKLDYKIVEFTDKELQINMEFINSDNEFMFIDAVIKNGVNF